jgi:septal ring factor EnvC (AmiA/AmiB activator)
MTCGPICEQNNMLKRELENLQKEKEDRERELLDEKDKLEKDVIKMRAELEAINRELQDLQDTRLSLELEIAAYRKLLEGEENRLERIAQSINSQHSLAILFRMICLRFVVAV